MDDTQTLAAAIAGAAGTIAVAIRWGVGRLTKTQDRGISALIENAKSQSLLAAKFDALADRLVGKIAEILAQTSAATSAATELKIIVQGQTSAAAELKAVVNRIDGITGRLDGIAGRIEGSGSGDDRAPDDVRRDESARNRSKRAASSKIPGKGPRSTSSSMAIQTEEDT